VLKFRRAEVLFRRVLNADESHAAALLGYAALLIDTGGALDKAQQMIQQVLIATHTYARAYAYAHPYEAEALSAFGTFAAKTSGDYVGAEGLYREALRKDPTHLQARRMSESPICSTARYHTYVLTPYSTQPKRRSVKTRHIYRHVGCQNLLYILLHNIIYMFSHPIQHSPLQRLVFRSACAVEHLRNSDILRACRCVGSYRPNTLAGT